MKENLTNCTFKITQALLFLFNIDIEINNKATFVFLSCFYHSFHLDLKIPSCFKNFNNGSIVVFWPWEIVCNSSLMKILCCSVFIVSAKLLLAKRIAFAFLSFFVSLENYNKYIKIFSVSSAATVLRDETV